MGANVSVTPEVVLNALQAAGLKAAKSRRYKLSEAYYSRVKFFANRAGAGPFTYTIPAGTKVKAFGYELDQSKTPGGFTAEDGLATLADTNIENRANTNSGEEVVIHGIACQLMPAGTHSNPTRLDVARMADYRLAAEIFSSCSVELSMNAGKNPVRLGIPNMIPGGGGLKGGAIDTIGRVALAGSPQAQPFASSGEATRANYYALPEGLTWKQQGKKDGSLQVLFELQREIVLVGGGDVDNATAAVVASNAAAVVATGTQGYVLPTEIMVELMIHIIGFVEGDSSNVS